MIRQIMKMVDFIAKMQTEKQTETKKVDRKFRMTPKRQRMILKVKEMTPKKQRMTPKMTPRIDE